MGRPSSRRWGMMSLCTAAVLPSLNTSIANAALPTLAGAFSASFHAVQWIVLSYLLATTTFIVSAGRLGDVMGRRRLLVAGVVVFTTGSVVCGVAPSLGLLIFGRTVQGVGAAAMIPLTLALVGETAAPGRTGRAMGLLGMMSALGTALGPSVGGLLVHLFGWHAVFLVSVPFGIVAALIAHRHLPADRPAQPARFDHLGTLLLGLALVAYALAMTVGGGRFGESNLALLIVAVLALALFVRVETTAPSPLVRFALMRDPAQRAGLALSGIVATVVMTTLVVGPFYLSRSFGLDVVSVGLVLSVGPLVAAMVGVAAGRLVDRLGSARVTRWGLSGVAAGCCLLSVLPTALGVGTYIASLAVMTAGYALFQTANNAAVLSSPPAAERGAVSGLLSLSRNLGLITGGAVMAAIFALASSSTQPVMAEPEAVATGARMTFAVAVLLMVIAFAIAGIHRSRAIDGRAGPRACSFRG